MNRARLSAFALLLAAAVPGAWGADAVELFDGKTLTGWDGDAKFWKVEDGAITGETSEQNKTPGNTFIIWKGGTVADFVLELDYRLLSDSGNSGIQYRSTDLGNHVVAGYQADFEAGSTYSGINYGERTGRDILAERGQRAWLGDGKTKNKTEKFADGKELQSAIKGKGEWNHYKITAKGNVMTHEINGTLMSETIDESAKDAKAEGILALQLHAGPPMKVQFKAIRLVTLTAAGK